MTYGEAEAYDNRERIMKYIVAYIGEHCYSPSVKEIANATELSTNTVRRHMLMLIEDHVLETDCAENDSRAYRIKGTKVVKIKEKTK